MLHSDSRIEDIEEKVEEEVAKCAHLHDEYNSTIEQTIKLIQEFHAKVRKGKK